MARDRLAEASPGSRLLSGRDLAAALAVVLIWGVNFAVMKLGLRAFTPFQLGAGRYLFAALPLVFFVRRPALPAGWLLAWGLAQGVGQFGLLFLALQVGMTAALASVVLQTQVFFTTLLGAIALQERVGRPLWIGLGLAAVGLGSFAFEIVDGRAGGTTLAGLVLSVGAAVGWGVSNIVARRAQRAYPDFDAVSFVVWCSLVPILPFVLLSWAFDPPAARWAWLQAGAASWAAVAFLGWIATVAGYGLWTGLLKRHPANRVAPFSLGVPLVGLSTGVLLLHERVTPGQWFGAACIVGSLAVVVVAPRLGRGREAPVPVEAPAGPG